MAGGSERGALVISLDFELHWGVRDHTPLDDVERKRLLVARTVIPEILRAFGAHGIRATWATVGFLFARSREEAQEYRPQCMPKYEQVELDPYREIVGRDESEDPFHFAPSLIRDVAQQAGQEVGSHSYSHYYPLERGQTEAEFGSDLASAKLIAEKSGYVLKSFVFPRNQVRPSYLPILSQTGFTAYRGTEPVAVKAPVNYREQRIPWKRAVRLMDAYWNLDGAQIRDWPRGERLVGVDASRYLRPYSASLRALEKARLKRIAYAMTRAALEKRIFHLWWHPEDFATQPERNLDFLDRVLTVFGEHRREYGMASLSMGDVSRTVQARGNESSGTLKTILEPVQ
jgi:peptidoglycan/xylan/chitin deacetylase (PgdA/CDA1 family)